MAYFAVLSVLYNVTGTGVKLTVTTDVACHLWMRWSHTPWDVHLVSEPVRGTSFSTKPYYCIVAYHDNEQEEPGDTLTHTFTKEPWEICETRYFHFWGEIGGLFCPSESCLLKYHLTEHAVPPSIVIVRPDAIGDHTNLGPWPLLPPFNWQKVDDVIPDENATLVRHSSFRGLSQAHDTYKFTIPPEVTDTISCVTITFRSKYQDFGGEDGSKCAGGLAKPPGFAAVSHNDVDLTANYFDYEHIMNVNPWTTLPWVLAYLATCQFSLLHSPKAFIGPDLWTSVYTTQIYMTIDY